MLGKKRETGIVLRNDEIAENIFDMWISAGEIASAANAGQFTAFYCKDGSRLLPRPISICETDKKEGALRVVFRTVGKGTEELSNLKEGMQVEMMGPLGNGFPLKEGTSLLIGGGIGIPPMLELARQMQGSSRIILGYKDTPFLSEEFRHYGEVYIATEDGSAGIKGNVIDVIREENLKADRIYACGPVPMLRALKEFAGFIRIECFVSLEERMACGIGACLGCVCKSGEVDPHTNVKNKRVCKEGPVFEAQEVDF